MRLFVKYCLVKASHSDIEYLKRAKFESIFQYAHDLCEDEISKIHCYVNEHMKMDVENYQLIYVEKNVVGCLLVVSKENEVMLDEIYLDEKYRNLGIGSNIIRKVIAKNKNVYLWVYKANTRAISLYRKLGFQIVEETKDRFRMRH